MYMCHPIDDNVDTERRKVERMLNQAKRELKSVSGESSEKKQKLEEKVETLKNDVLYIKVGEHVYFHCG